MLRKPRAEAAQQKVELSEWIGQQDLKLVQLIARQEHGLAGQQTHQGIAQSPDTLIGSAAKYAPYLVDIALCSSMPADWTLVAFNHCKLIVIIPITPSPSKTYN